MAFEAASSTATIKLCWACSVLTGVEDEHDRGVGGEDVLIWKDPAGGCLAGSW
jgi:hypothetical protein